MHHLSKEKVLFFDKITITTKLKFKNLNLLGPVVESLIKVSP